MSFGTSIQCMDGRIQEPVVSYLKNKYKVNYIDVITEAGPCKILAELNREEVLNSIYERVDISINKHGSKIICISGHHDCAGNPISKKEQINHINMSAQHLCQKYPKISIVKLWINDNWEIEEF